MRSEKPIMTSADGLPGGARGATTTPALSTVDTTPRSTSPKARTARERRPGRGGGFIVGISLDQKATSDTATGRSLRDLGGLTVGRDGGARRATVITTTTTTASTKGADGMAAGSRTDKRHGEMWEKDGAEAETRRRRRKGEVVPRIERSARKWWSTGCDTGATRMVGGGKTSEGRDNNKGGAKTFMLSTDPSLTAHTRTPKHATTQQQRDPDAIRHYNNNIKSASYPRNAPKKNCDRSR